jgi:hypothetical protein
MSNGEKSSGKGRPQNEWVALVRELLPLVFLSGGGFIKSCSLRFLLLVLMLIDLLLIPSAWVFWIIFGEDGRTIGIGIMLGAVAAMVLLVWLFGQTSKIQDVEIIEEALGSQFAAPAIEGHKQESLPDKPTKQITTYDEGGEDIGNKKDIEGEYKRIDEREIDV